MLLICYMYQNEKNEYKEHKICTVTLRTNLVSLQNFFDNYPLKAIVRNKNVYYADI